VRIQEIIPICKKYEGQYARPDSWVGQGRGVDLGQHLTNDGVKEVVIITENGNALGSNWNPTPEELMESWMLVNSETLWKESKHE
jgi:hypothetical protein